MDLETQEIIENLARFVAEGGPEVEAIAIERNRENPAFRFVCVSITRFQIHFLSFFFFFVLFLSFRSNKNVSPFSSFLFDQQSPAYFLYRKKLQEYHFASQRSSPSPADSRTEVQRPVVSSLPVSSPQLTSTSMPQHQESEMPPVKRKRKSRWGSEEDKVQLPVPPIVIPQDVNVPDPNTPSLSGKPFV